MNVKKSDKPLISLDMSVEFALFVDELHLLGRYHIQFILQLTHSLKVKQIIGLLELL